VLIPTLLWLAFVVTGYLAVWAIISKDAGPGGGIVASLVFIAIHGAAFLAGLAALIITIRYWRAGGISLWAKTVGLLPALGYSYVIIGWLANGMNF
jgi:cytochrome c oxidase assembly factor CtaG